MATLTARGYATVAVQPDFAELALVLTAVAPTADEAYGQIAESGQALAALLEELGVRREDRVVGGFQLHEEQEYDQNGRATGARYRAHSRTIVRLNDPAAVGALIRVAVERVGAGVEGPRWIVDGDNPARLDACRSAAERAAERARAYADALGVTLGPLTGATELGAAAPGVPLHAHSFASVDNAYPVESGQMEVAAAVDVTYEVGSA